MKKKVTIRTSKWILILVAFLFVIIIIRLGYVCLSKSVDDIDLKAFADSRNTVNKVLYASRGSIFDTEGEVLAESVNAYTVIAYLSSTRDGDHVEDINKTAEALSPILGISVDKLIETLSKDKYQVELKRDVKELLKSEIKELDLPGIDFVESTTRYYKSGTFASYIIGYAKKSEDGQINGELGIESYYNDILKGTNGSKIYQKDAYGYQIPNTDSYTEEAISGSDIYLTIDSNIQLIAENAIKDLSKNRQMSWAFMVVMDSDTGAIVASATNPSFDPNDLSTITEYMNPLVSYQYEPGSTMKTFSFATAIDSGNYNGSDTFKSGSIEVADVVIKDANKTGWGIITYDQGYAYSSNVGASYLALKVGVKTLTSYYQNLGFGEQTGIELANEAKGDINFLYKSELATAAFGQGISVTPIQMLQALTTITNDGMMIKPYIVKKIVDENGKVTYEGKRQEVRQVFNKTTADYMQKLMYNVVYNGLSKSWQTDNVTLMGKTGTAQIASSKGGYLSGEYDYIRSFTGIFPAEDPKYIIYVASKQLVGSMKDIANVTTKAVEEIASYAKITNNQDEDKNEAITIDNYMSKETTNVVSTLESLNLKPIVLGNGKYIINQYPLKDTKVYANSKIFLLTNGNDILMPNILNYSLNEVNTLTSLLKIKYTSSGYGYVNSQSIPEGTIIDSQSTLNIILK